MTDDEGTRPDQSVVVLVGEGPESDRTGAGVRDLFYLFLTSW